MTKNRSGVFLTRKSLIEELCWQVIKVEVKMIFLFANTSTFSYLHCHCTGYYISRCKILSRGGVTFLKININKDHERQLHSMKVTYCRIKTIYSANYYSHHKSFSLRVLQYTTLSSASLSNQTSSTIDTYNIK